MMNTLTKSILKHAKKLAEGTPIRAKELLHLGNRAAVDQALSRLVKRGQLMRAGRGVYVLPVESRFGKRAPSAWGLVKKISRTTGEVIVPHGAASANKLGLTTQVPVRAVYLTSGRSRQLKLGLQVVELRHAASWHFALGSRPAGEMLQALSWLGPERAETALRTLKQGSSESRLQEIASVRSVLPSWLAKQVSEVVMNG